VYFVPIQLPKSNQSAPDKVIFRTARRFQPLFIQSPLVAHNLSQRALIPLSMGCSQKMFGTKNKGIRACLERLWATKGHWINRGFHDHV
jgi:hypothetical protein